MRPRGLHTAACTALALCCALPAWADRIVAATYAKPVTHYAHGVLGDAEDYGALVITLDGGRSFRLTLPNRGRVFEDIAPRLWDVTGDGAPEVVVVETDPPQGAQLAVYGLGADGVPMKLAATPHIGQTNRWLAPIGAADLDGDGRVEIAYIDRPHLAKTLRIWRFDAGNLQPVTDLPGLTNHQIGWDHIPGGLRDCGAGPELITADGGWQNVMATRLSKGRAETQAIARYTGPDSVNAALACN